jgi:hypothetical protein
MGDGNRASLRVDVLPTLRDARYVPKVCPLKTVILLITVIE